MSLSREDLRKKFEEEYQRLNEKQKEAVDHIEGPVMVIAGPGTGKTQILASRIGRILLDTDTAPENILCLTYTKAAAAEMRKRVAQFLGSWAIADEAALIRMITETEGTPPDAAARSPV